MTRRELLAGVAPAALSMAPAVAAGGKLRAGAAVSNITPPLGTVLAGSFTPQRAAEVHDELLVKSLVLDNGNTRLAFALCDLCVTPRDAANRAKEAIERETGMPPGNVMIASTHTHSGPATIPLFQSEPDPAYLEWLAGRIADSVRMAVKRLEPCRIGVGFGREDRVVFNRRYYMKPGTVNKNPFGGNDLVKTNPGYGNPNVVKPAGPVDPAVGVLAVEAHDGRPMAVLANYCLHYVGGVGPAHVSADYFAYWRKRWRGLPERAIP